MKRIALMILGGLAIGALTVLGQGVLPGSWNHFANSGAVWLLGAFMIGATMPSFRWAIPAGVVALFGAVIGYTLTVGLFGYSYSTSAILFWGAVGLVGGPVFGAAGHAWRSDELRQRVIGVGLLGGVFVAEGWFMIQYNHDLLAGWVSIGIGVLFSLLLARSAREKLYTLLAMLPITALGMGAFALVNGIIYT